MAPRVFGNEAAFAIMVDLGADPADFHLRFSACGRSFGNFEAVTHLQGCRSWAREFVKNTGKRDRPECRGMSARQAMAALYDVVFARSGPGGCDWVLLGHLRNLHHLDQVGMDSLRDRFSVLLIGEGENERLICRENRSGDLFDCRFSAGTVDAVLLDFIRWAEADPTTS